MGCDNFHPCFIPPHREPHLNVEIGVGVPLQPGVGAVDPLRAEAMHIAQELSMVRDPRALGAIKGEISREVQSLDPRGQRIFNAELQQETARRGVNDPMWLAEEPAMRLRDGRVVPPHESLVMTDVYNQPREIAILPQEVAVAPVGGYAPARPGYYGPAPLNNTVVDGVGGAVAGAIIDRRHPGVGALIGGALGAVVGNGVDQSQQRPYYPPQQ